MSINSVSRRDILKTLTMGAMATSVLRVIPAHAAEYAHHMVAAEKAAAPAGAYTSEVFLAQRLQDTPGAVPGHHSARTANAAARSRRARRNSSIC